VNRHSRSGVFASAVIAALATLGLLLAPVAAWTGPAMTERHMVRTVGGGTAQPGNIVRVPPGNVVVGAPRPPSHDFGPSYPFGYHYAGQGPVLYAAPAHAAPRWIPGHWARQWVPLYYTYDVWVPGYYASDGGWIDGFYDPRTVQSGGYYQQVWVDGGWAQ
jgi:hypothetical protein